MQKKQTESKEGKFEKLTIMLQVSQLRLLGQLVVFDIKYVYVILENHEP